jgi:hypothetical protein
MHRAEARWLAGRLARLGVDELSPLLNVGSSNEHFRTARQPWINEVVFAPLLARGITVTHLDMKADAGVDIVGDLMNGATLGMLRPRGFRALVCSNVLEHVTDRAALCAHLDALLPAGGYLFVTVPRQFPYHADPIDTGFRPSTAELVALFPNLDVVAAEEVDCGSMMDSFTRGAMELAMRLAWLFVPFLRWRGWVGNVHRLASFRSRYRATCAVLRRR